MQFNIIDLVGLGW